MPTVEFKLWIGEICLGTVELHDERPVWIFNHRLEGRHSVRKSHEGRWLTARDCVVDVCKLLPATCRNFVIVARIEAGITVKEYSWDEVQANQVSL